MKFYIDFEATQFSQRIISIGCVAEEGSTFQSYVHLCKGDKLTNFITALTGITEEDLKDAPSADQVFSNFIEWVESFNSTQNTFYCYGDTDSSFIKNTMNKMKNFNSIMAASYVRDNLVDYSKTAAKFFDVKALGLYRIYALTHEEMVEQKHDALEDAMMLKYVEENLLAKYSAEDVKKMPKSKRLDKKKFSKSNPVPQYYLNWANQSKVDSITSGTENNYVISASFPKNRRSKEMITKYFTSIEESAYWAFCYGCISNRSPKNKEQFDIVVKNINKRVKSSNNFAYGLKWKKNPNI